MAEYIEREAALSLCGWYNTVNGKSICAARKDELAALPAADVVEIPCRCKDCKNWKHFDHLGCTDFVKVCGLSNYMIGANGYCLYGERRDDHAV